LPPLARALAEPIVTKVAERVRPKMVKSFAPHSYGGRERERVTERESERVSE
jgi:hypothetical protein